MRQYIRHPTDIPINFDFVDVVHDKKDFLNDISEGGLSFRSCTYLEPGTELLVKIPVHTPVFEEKGVVVWNAKNEDCWDVGVKFIDDASDFRLRMIEQVCHIEHYRKEVREKEGRDLSGSEAAAEWIQKFAKDFPR